MNIRRFINTYGPKLFICLFVLLAPSLVSGEFVQKQSQNPPQNPNDEGFIIKSEEGKEAPGLHKSQMLDGLFTGMTSADLKKDGSKELFLLSKKKVVIARLNQGTLEVIKEIKAVDGADNIAITSLGDAVYISSVFNNKPYSSVLEFRDNNYRVTVTGVEWLMRAVQGPDGKTVLIGQKFRKPEGFYGELRVLEKEGSKVVDKGPFMALPRYVDIYRFDILKSNSGKEIVTLNDRDYLRVYKKEAENKWENTYGSDDFYGGTLNYINYMEDRPGVETAPVPVEGGLSRVGRKDGKTELIIKKNVPGGLGRFAEKPMSFTKGEVVSLVWDGLTFIENWKTKEVKGYIADFFIEDSGGERTITMLVVEGINAVTGGTPKSYVLSYKFSI